MFIANFKKDAHHAASLASSQIIAIEQPPAVPGSTPDMAGSSSLERRAPALDARTPAAKPAAAGADEAKAPKVRRRIFICPH